MQVKRSRMYRVQEIAQMVDVSMSTVYRAIEAGDLPAVRIGRSTRVQGAELASWLTSAGSTVDLVADTQGGAA